MIRNYIISFDRQKYTPACQKQIYTLFKSWKWGGPLFLLQLISRCVIRYLHSTERGLSRIRRAQRSFFPSGSSKSTSEQYPDTFPEPVLGLSRVDSISSLTLKPLSLSWLRGGGGKFWVREDCPPQQSQSSASDHLESDDDSGDTDIVIASSFSCCRSTALPLPVTDR